MTRLPLIDRAIDNSALSTFMTCPREYDFAYRQGYRPKEKSQALSFGSFWHRLMETHYKTGGSMDAVMDVFNRFHKEVPDSGDYRTAARALAEYQKYRKEYPLEKDVQATIGFPDTPMVEISTAIASPNLLHEWAGKIDRIVMDGDLAYVEDHKTTSRLDKHYFSQFQNSNQMMGYVWMAQQLLPGIKVVGVRINLLHILTASSAFDRQIITYSESRLKEWEENTNHWLHQLEEAYRALKFPAHFGDNGCSRKFGNCQFFDVCKSSTIIRQAVLEQDFKIEHWDPLAHKEE